MEKIIGIDLGTSNSAAAVMLGGRPTIIPSAEGMTVGGKMFPSYVALTKNGELLVGEPARRQAVTNPDGTVMAIKRKMGTDHRVDIHGKEYTPQQISAFILQKIKTDAEAFLGEPVKKSVITVPAYFNDNQRNATKEAGLIADLEVVRIINEPTAASLAYGLDRAGTEQKILVFDLGGGTLDVTIMDYGDGVFEVASTSGDTRLGGTDMDNSLVNHISEEFRKESGLDLRNDKMATQRVREAAEKAKIELSSVIETEISLPFISADASGPKHLVMKITRAQLEEIVKPIVDRCEKSVRQALDDARLKPSDIDKVILVGGPTRMPIVRKFVESYFSKNAERGIDPMECVAVGAAIQGSVISGEVKDILLLDVTPLSLGVETVGAVLTKVIERNTTIPTRKSQIFTTAQDNQVSVDINVLQGERPMAEDNISLGKFTLAGIPFAPRGVPQIEVTFDIDASGILHVSARDTATGQEQKITITSSTRLSKEQIDAMRRDSDKFATDDRKRKEWVEVKNKAESTIYSTRKAISDLGEKIPGGDRSKLESEIDCLSEVIDRKDTDATRERTEDLIATLHGISAALYAKVGTSGGERVGTAEYEAVKGDAERGDTHSKFSEEDYHGTHVEVVPNETDIGKDTLRARWGKKDDSPQQSTDDSDKYWEEEEKKKSKGSKRKGGKGQGS